MSIRIHQYGEAGVRAEVTPYGGRYRVNVSGPRHPHGLLPIITEKEVDQAMARADSMAQELYSHDCFTARCAEWEQEGAKG
jgi:hypothetical protein